MKKVIYIVLLLLLFVGFWMVLNVFTGHDFNLMETVVVSIIIVAISGVLNCLQRS